MSIYVHLYHRSIYLTYALSSYIAVTDGRCAPTGLKINEKHDDDEDCTISWDAPPCDKKSYTLHYTDIGGRTECQEKIIDGNMTSHTHVNGLDELQLAAHQHNNMTECSEGMYALLINVIIHSR